MDFIPLPDNAIAHEVIPDLGGPEFDHQGFHGYDQRQGWNVAALRKGSLRAACTNWLPWADSIYSSERPPGPPVSINKLVGTVAGAFVQTWILLGILQEALKRPVFRHEVSRCVTEVDSEGRTMSTHHITVRNVFAEFMKKGKELESDSVWANRLYHSLREAAELLRDLELLHDRFASAIAPVHVHFALLALVRAFDQHRMNFCRKQLDSANLIGIAPTRCRRFESILRDHHGWCPSMLTRVFETLELQGLYFASLMPGFGTGQDHSNCHYNVCVASNIDHGTYKVQHVPTFCPCERERCDHTEPMCICPHVTVEGSELAAALGSIGFPLVRLQGEAIEVVRFEPGVAYVAISHVWSDGRGNPRANALPRCQIQAIQGYVSALTGARNMLFWMDTLCVPLQEPLRNTAIIRMAEVYRSATQVLVLAKDMLSINLPSTPTEALCRIFCSQWASRLWTMQEAALAKELVFQFADDVAAHDTLSREMTDIYLNGSEQTHHFGVTANHSFRQFRNIQQGSSSEEENIPIVSLWRSLRFRSTSRKSDVAICAAILLARGLETVLSVPDEEKMQAFWSCQQTVPSSILWAAGPRLRVDGFRWAPSNLLNPETASLPPDPIAAVATPTGAGLLVAGIDAVILENVPLPSDEAVVLRFELPSTGERHFCFKFLSENPERWLEIQHLWSGRCVLLLSPFHFSHSRTVGALVLPTDPLPDWPCDEDEPETIAGRYLARVNIIAELDPSEDGMVRTNDGCDALRNSIRLQMTEVLDVVGSKSVDPGWKWCIS
ncbi:hypothetical protein CLAIMM_12233 [Cladophialophora immunda]|nr:hypothetical protein CLAIMM_12233 [Cladophialophora immunda]